MIEHFFSGGLMAPTTLILERGAVMIRKALLLILLVSLFLSACNTTTSESITDAISNSGVEASNDSVTHIQALSDHYWIAASPDVITRGSANSAGFYQIIMQSNGRSNLLFTDHAAEKQVYLCSTPSCEHSDASCSSFIDSAGYYVFPVALEDKLLVVYSYISLPDEAPKPSKVEMMDLNGTNRRTLCELENGITLRDGAAASEKSLILCGNRVQENGQGQVQVQPCLFEIDIETGACSELYRTAAAEGEQQKSLFLRGVSDTGFILKTITTEEYETSEDMQADIERMENATVHRVFELPFDGPFVVKPAESDTYWKHPFPTQKKAYILQTRAEAPNMSFYVTGAMPTMKSTAAKPYITSITGKTKARVICAALARAAPKKFWWKILPPSLLCAKPPSPSQAGMYSSMAL